jgi:bifunctional DNA-binding transcriptional regulator/antitoxin component of YhaV-PrlF toxin-antitoxin module
VFKTEFKRKIDNKGRLTIPRRIFTVHELTGAQVEFFVENDLICIRRVADDVQKSEKTAK